LELDGRKSKEKNETFLELVLAKHNDPEWLPQSQPISGFHTRLRVSHVLPLYAEYKLLDVCRYYTTMKGTFNKMLSNYKTSRNGSLNLKDSHKHSDNSDGDKNEEEFVDENEKTKFCLGKVHHSYFWALAEMNQLTTTVSQSCNKIGVSTGSNSTISSTSSSTIQIRKERKMNMDDRTEMMLNQVVSLCEEMANMNNDRSLHLMKVELRETNQQLNEQ
jgi:hypothetical protein